MISHEYKESHLDAKAAEARKPPLKHLTAVYESSSPRSAMNTASVSIRSIRAPVQAMVRRQYSSSAASATSTAANVTTVGHSTRVLAIASGVSAVVGADMTYAYFTRISRCSQLSRCHSTQALLGRIPATHTTNTAPLTAYRNKALKFFLTFVQHVA